MERRVTLRSASFLSRFLQDSPLASASLISCDHLRPGTLYRVEMRSGALKALERAVPERRHDRQNRRQRWATKSW